MVKRYALFQIPALSILALVVFPIAGWLDLPPWLPWTALALWIVKDIALFPILWRSYMVQDGGDAGGMIGLRGSATERIVSEGRVMARGELWKAVLHDDASPVEPGDEVRIIAARGLTLVVEPAEGRDSPP